LLPSIPSTQEIREDTKLGLAAEVLRRHGSVFLKARGVSMLPAVWPGDLLTIQRAAYDEVAAGDVVLVLRDHRFCIHRLVGWQRGREGLLSVTRGDAMPQDDPPAAASEVLGRVARIRRGNRSFVPSRRVSMLHSALAWMLCRWSRFRSLALRIHWAYSQAVSLTPAAQADHEKKPVIAALKRRASQNQVHHGITSRIASSLSGTLSRASHP
jgi:Peptidase S24-like